MLKKFYSITSLMLITFMGILILRCGNELNNPMLMNADSKDLQSKTLTGLNKSSNNYGLIYNFYITCYHRIDSDDKVFWAYTTSGTISDPNDLNHGDGKIPGIFENDVFIGSLTITDPNGFEFSLNRISYETGALYPDDPHVDRLEWGTESTQEISDEPPIGDFTCELEDAFGNFYIRTNVLTASSIEQSRAFPVIVYPENGSTITDKTPTFHWKKYPNEPLEVGHMENYICLHGPLHLPHEERINYWVGSEEGGPHSHDTDFFFTYPEGGDPNLPEMLITGDYFLSLTQNVSIEGGYPHPNYTSHYRTIQLTVASYIETQVDIDPNTLNLKSKGKWITAYINPPEGYIAEDININTVKLWYNGQYVSAEKGNIQNDVLMAKFSRSDVASILDVGDAIELTVKGELSDGIGFEGSDTIRVIDN